MICVERIHRIIMAIFIIASIGVMHGYDFFIGTYMLVFMAVMLLIWALTNFCPGVFILKKLIPTCKFGKKE
ncbi:MAG: hypothetical protein CR967_04285 [Proteobacteria bacterium]|nr:MAG: hypothetical protein CR967_04285 [Pseudomonadota bacterium]